MKRSVVSVFTVAVIIFLLQPYFVFSQSNDGGVDQLNQQIAEKREKVKELEESIERVKKEIDKRRHQTVSLKNQMAIIDNRVTQVELDISLTQTKLDTLALEIESLELLIAEKKDTIARQKDLMSNLLRTVHYQNRKNTLVVLAAYDTFSDFYTEVHQLQTVDSELTRTARSIRFAKEDLEEKERIAEERQASYETLKVDLENRKQDLGEQHFAKQTLLVQTQSSELTYKTLLSNLRKQYQEIESEISNIEQQVRKKLEEQHRLEDQGSFDGLFGWPVQSHVITAYFHDPDYPFRNVFEHSGLDIRAGQGTPVKAVGSGYVARAKRCSSPLCYSYVMIIHTSGLSTVYGHLGSVSVTDDQFVTRGDVIGYSGGTPGTAGAGPFVTGPHLHFEVRQNGIPVDPLGFVAR